MLKTSSTESAEPRKGVVGVGGGSRAGRDRGGIDGSEMNDVEVDGGEVEVDEVGKKARTSKSKNSSKSKKAVGPSDFLTPGAKLAFTKLRQAILKTSILHYFNPERHIRIKTDVLGSAIGGVLSQLTSNDLGRWHPMVFFSRKMIPAETRYET